MDNYSEQDPQEAVAEEKAPSEVEDKEHSEDEAQESTEDEAKESKEDKAEESKEDEAKESKEDEAKESKEDKAEEPDEDEAKESKEDEAEESDEDEEDDEATLPLPSKEESLALLTEVDCPQEVIDHSIAVAELALKICEMYDIHNEKKCNVELVEAGALLHDIGRVKTHEVSHNIEGSQLLKEKGYPKDLCLVVERHVGAGIDVSETESLGLPERNFIPQKLEERIVAHADNLINGINRIMVESLIKELVDKDQIKIASRVIRLHNKLSKLCGMDLDEIE